MKTTIVARAVAAAIFLPLLCSALDLPKRFVNKIESGSIDLKSKVHSIVDARTLAVDTLCPVCNSGGRSGTGPIKTALSRIKRLRGSRFATLKDALLASQSKFGKEVPIDDVVTVLSAAGSHFSGIASNVQSMKSSNSTEESSLSAEIFMLLEDVASISAQTLNELSVAVQSSDKASIGTVVNILLSILGFFERANSNVISVVVNSLSAVSGEDGEAVTVKAFPLRKFFSSSGEGGVLGNVLGFLSSAGDDSGLAAVISNATTAMQNIEARVQDFQAHANTAIATSAETNERAIQGNTINEILDLIISIINSIISLIVGIITTIINLVVGIIKAIINLIVGIISAIVNLLVSILNAILGIFSLQAQSKSSSEKSSSGTSPLGALLSGNLAPSNLFQTTVCILDPECSVKYTNLDCQKEALVCSGNALSVSLP